MKDLHDQHLLDMRAAQAKFDATMRAADAAYEADLKASRDTLDQAILQRLGAWYGEDYTSRSNDKGFKAVEQALGGAALQHGTMVGDKVEAEIVPREITQEDREWFARTGRLPGDDDDPTPKE